jgi:hypothetical protein
MREIGVITVEEFKKTVETFGFNSPVVTAIWNTMESNPDNAEGFETVYALNANGRFSTYRIVDTGETFTYDELVELWRQFGHEMSYKCLDDFIEYAVEEVKG